MRTALVLLTVLLFSGCAKAWSYQGLGARNGVAHGVVAAGGVILPGLPTANPVVAGQLWNDSGTVKVSAG